MVTIKVTESTGTLLLQHNLSAQFPVNTSIFFLHLIIFQFYSQENQTNMLTGKISQ